MSGDANEETERCELGGGEDEQSPRSPTETDSNAERHAKEWAASCGNPKVACHYCNECMREWIKEVNYNGMCSVCRPILIEPAEKWGSRSQQVLRRREERVAEARRRFEEVQAAPIISGDRYMCVGMLATFAIVGLILHAFDPTR